MKKFLFISIVLILSACTPQVTELPTATLAPPTQTPIPAPIFHPDFIALQNLIENAGKRFTLLPDGTIEELTADGGRQTIPNLHVGQNGVINIIFNNEHVVIEHSQITFNDEKGLTIKGYELDDSGEWVEAISPEIQSAMADFDKYGYQTDHLEFKQNGDDVWAVDTETKKTVYEKDGDSQYGKFYLEYVVAQASQQDLMPTTIEPRQDILEATGRYYVADRAKAFEYFGPLSKRARAQFEQEYGYKPVAADGDLSGIHEMLNPDPAIRAWGFVIKDLAVPELDFTRFLYYELADGTIHIVPLR